MKRAIIILALFLLLSVPTITISTVYGDSGSNDITSDTTWTRANSPFTVAGTITVKNGATLTIEPGAIVNIAQGASLRVEGTFVAKGTDTAFIQLSGPGELVLTFACTDWNDQTNSGTIIEKTVINGLLITTCNSPKISDNLIHARLQLYGGSPKITHNSIEGYIESNTDLKSLLFSNNRLVGQLWIGGGSPTIVQNYIVGMQHPGNSASSGIGMTATNGDKHIYNAVITDNTIIDVTDGISILADGGTITNNLIVNCSRFGISLGTMLDTTAVAHVEDNTIINSNVALHLFNYNEGAKPPIIQQNNVINSSQYNVEYRCGLNMSLANNWWGTTDLDVIKQTIHDHTFDPYAGIASYIPVLTAFNPHAYPKSSSGIPGPITVTLPDVNSTMAPNSFAIESNSTVSALFYNPSSPEIDFTVNGTTGSSGYVKVTISKVLMPSSEGIKVYLDQTPIDFNLTSSVDAWTIEFTYHHSTHQVRINQEIADNDTKANNGLYNPYILLGVTAILVCLLSTIYVLRKRFAKPKQALFQL